LNDKKCVATPGRELRPSCPFEAYSSLFPPKRFLSCPLSFWFVALMTSQLTSRRRTISAVASLDVLSPTRGMDMHAPSSRAVSLWLVNGYWARFARPWRGLRPRPAGRVHVLSTCESECVGVGWVGRTPNILFENIWVHGKFLGFSGGVCL